MTAARKPLDEAQRMQALCALDILDTPPERKFDALVKTAALACDVPISLISLVDADRQWFKANLGMTETTETKRSISFCSHAIIGDGLLEVSDSRLDARFADNPLVTATPGMLFYAGIPLRLSNGHKIGTICVIDHKPRQLTKAQRSILEHLSVAVVEAMETRQLARGYLASDARFRALSDASPLGVFSADAAGAGTYTNTRWQAIYGLSDEQALGDGWISSVHPQDRQTVKEQWQHATSNRLEFNQQYRVLRPDGVELTVRSSARSVTDNAGEIVGFTGAVQDISEQVFAQQTITEERQRLAAIIQGTDAGTWEWNILTGETRFNERWAEIVGRRLVDLAPLSIETWNLLTHPDDLEKSHEHLKLHFAGEVDTYECEARMRHQNGHWVWVQDRGKVRTWTVDGQPEWMFGTHLNITDRKEWEQALRKSEWLLKRTGALADVGGWEFDIETETLIWSEQTRRIHGVDENYQPHIDTAISFYAPEAQVVIQQAIDSAIKTGSSWDLELPFIRATGERIWVRAVCQTELEGQKPARLLGAFQDITERVLQRQALELAHRHSQLATNSGGIGIWEFDLSLGTMTMDQQMRRLYKVPDADDTGLSNLWSRRLHKEDAARVMTAMKAAIEDDQAYDDEYRIVLPDGSIRHLRAAAQVSRDNELDTQKLVGVNWDVTALRELSTQLANQHELLHVTLQSIGDAVITTDADGLITWLNPVAERMTGFLSSKAIGCPSSQVFHILNEDSRQLAHSPVDICLREARIMGLVGNTLLISRDGSEFGIESSAAPIRNGKGDVLGVVLVFRDVTEKRRLSEEMNYRATHDPLTGLLNRTEFETRLLSNLARAQDSDLQHSLLFIDLDQFKLVNDTCGHSVGDQLLIQIAAILSETVRTGDTLARLGGDEFAVILQDCSPDKAFRVAQQICDRMNAFSFINNERRFRLGTSIGLVPVDKRWEDITAVMQAADTACYAAKEAGRNRVHQWFDTEQLARVRQGETQWATRLEQALYENEFILHAQRITPLSGDGSKVQAEVLLRLPGNGGDLIQPGAFLPAAERFHLASRIDRWVLTRTVDYLASLQNTDAFKMLCINLSGQSVSDRAFHRDAIETLRMAGPGVCELICLEITETAAVTAIADAAAFIDQVRQLGVRVALDDFGAGASSFGYLKTLKVDMIKIDGQFIKDLNTDPLDAATVRCFVDIARVLGVTTVAEFVDRPEVMKRVQDIGVDFAQGFLIHEPEAIENLVDGYEEVVS